MLSTICAFTPDRQALFRYDGSPNNWTRITAAERLGQAYGGGFGLFVTDLAPDEDPGLLQWHRSFDGWITIGGPGAQFAATKDTVFGLTPNRQAVFRYDGAPTQTSWTQVGGPATQLYAGTFGLVATSPTNGQLFRYLGTPNNWEFIGEAGASFAVTRSTVFGLTPNKQAVFRYLGHGNSWEQVGGPASEIYAGDSTLLATSPVNGNLFRFIRPLGDKTDFWEQIGGPGAQFAVATNVISGSGPTAITTDVIFGLTPDKQAVFRYDGSGTSWTRIGGPADSILAFEPPVF
jgi:hypothetical protein